MPDDWTVDSCVPVHVARGTMVPACTLRLCKESTVTVSKAKAQRGKVMVLVDLPISRPSRAVGCDMTAASGNGLPKRGHQHESGRGGSAGRAQQPKVARRERQPTDGGVKLEVVDDCRMLSANLEGLGPSAGVRAAFDGFEDAVLKGSTQLPLM